MLGSWSVLIYFADACEVFSLHLSAYAVAQFVLDGAKPSEAFVFKSHDSCSVNLSIQSRNAGLWKLETILERLSHTIPSVLKHEVGSRTSHKVWKLHDSTKGKVVLCQKGKQQVDLDGTKDVLTFTSLILSWTNVFVYLAWVIADQTVKTAFNQCCCLSWMRFRTSSSWANKHFAWQVKHLRSVHNPCLMNIYNSSGFNHSGVDNHPVAFTT